MFHIYISPSALQLSLFNSAMFRIPDSNHAPSPLYVANNPSHGLILGIRTGIKGRDLLLDVGQIYHQKVVFPDCAKTQSYVLLVILLLIPILIPTWQKWT